MPELISPVSAIGGALLHASSASTEPVLVVGGSDGTLQVLWANRAFADAVCAEVVDLADAAVTSVIRAGADGADLPLNAVRVSTFRATLVPRVGVASSWDATAYPTPSDDRSWVITLRPATDSLRMDELLRASEERFRVLSERAPIGIFSSEVGLRFGYVNDWFAELVGLPAERLLGMGWTSVVDPDDLDAVCSGLQDTLAGSAFERPARLTTVGGEQRWVTFRAVPVHDPDSPASFLGTVEDVTDRRRFEELLSWQASHDPLTGLPNRSQLAGEIALALAEGKGDVAVLFLDLDDFKLVNDSLGHAAGDELLVTVASRLRTAVRDGDRVYRFAGDEFVVLARGASSDAEALGIANRLRSIVAEPLTLAHEELQVRCSAGVVRADEHATPETLLRDADVAMYQAKRNSKGSAALFDSSVRNLLDDDLEFTAWVREAIGARATTVTYSPVVSLEGPSPTVVALEAGVSLVDDGAEVPAATVLEVARVAKLTRPLVFALLDQVCADLGAWRSGENDGPQWVCLPLTPVELAVPGLVDHLARALVRHRLVGSDLGIALGRAATTAPAVGIASVLDQLTELGVRLAGSDPDVSLASPLRLADTGLAAVRLDVAAAVHDERAAKVLAAMVRLADDLGVEVVGGGLENDEAVQRARELGLRLATGPAFGHGVIGAVVSSMFEAER